MSKIKVPADSVSGESPLPGTQRAIFSLCSHTLETARELSGVSFTRTLIPFTRAPPSWPHHLPKVSPPNPAISGIRFHYMNLGRIQTFGL